MMMVMMITTMRMILTIRITTLIESYCSHRWDLPTRIQIQQKKYTFVQHSPTIFVINTLGRVRTTPEHGEKRERERDRDREDGKKKIFVG